MRVLETKRLLLKPVEEDDLHELLALQWDKDLMRLMNFKPLSMDNQRDWIKSLGKSSFAFSIFLKIDNSTEFSGFTTLNNIDSIHRRATWGIKLKSDIQSKGIGYEASLVLFHFGFSTLNLQKIHSDLFLDNIASKKMCSKIGTREIGILTNHYYHNGEFRDVIIVEILKEEFYRINIEILKELGLFI